MGGVTSGGGAKARVAVVVNNEATTTTKSTARASDRSIDTRFVGLRLTDGRTLPDDERRWVCDLVILCLDLDSQYAEPEGDQAPTTAAN